MSQRNQRRQVKKVQEKTVRRINHPLPSPLENPQGPIQVLAGEIEKLSQVVNHNANLFTHTLTVGEMRAMIMQRVMNDQMIGEVRTTEMERIRWTEEWGLGADGTARMLDVPVKEMVIAVDYAWYQQYFMCCMVFTEMTMWLKGLDEGTEAPDVQPEVVSPIILRPDMNGVEEFGGSP
jgi:hypothetical protein